MDILQWLQARENATLILALIGAVNGTLGLMISFLNRHDANRLVRRAQARRAAWASLRIEAGDRTGCMVRASFFNPSDFAFVIDRVTVETPEGGQVIMMRQNPLDLLGPLVPDLRGAGGMVPVNWTVRALAETPEIASFHEEFIVADRIWSPESRTRWRAASKMRQTSVVLRFSGQTLSAGREPVDLLVTAAN